MARVVAVTSSETKVASGVSGVAAGGGLWLHVSLPSSLGEGPRPTGRGARVHVARACIEGAERRGLSRALRREVRVARGALGAALGRLARARAAELFASAARQGCAVPITTVDDGAARVAGDDEIVLVVARDAGFEASAESVAVGRAAAKGKAVVLGTRAWLGEQVRVEGGSVGSGVAVVAVRHPRLGRGLAEACALAGSVAFEGLEVG